MVSASAAVGAPTAHHYSGAGDFFFV
ncbi:hypothetical protein SBBP2_1850009 [Burkholderiales bacterium]|nr:hypothetical protein SBBP2_1850009 [Burkholderiales bacterium]